jgi:hypothetical protein
VRAERAAKRHKPDSAGGVAALLRTKTQKFKVRAKVARARKVKAPVEAAAAAVVMPAPGGPSTSTEAATPMNIGDDVVVRVGMTKSGAVKFMVNGVRKVIGTSKIPILKHLMGLPDFSGTLDGMRAKSIDNVAHGTFLGKMKKEKLVLNERQTATYTLTPLGVKIAAML